MKMLELELYGYILLAFNAIEKVVYKPDNDVQIIIGSNGSGKSSLMNQCNPLPVDKKFMTDKGYKIYRCEHRGLEYTLHYTYGKHRKCSFIEHNPDKGDVELNEGGTTVAQKVLIERIFGLDVNLMNIWLGKTCFTKLAPIKRRDWILKLSGSDLDYAMAIYNRFKNDVNDAKSVERHYVKRLSDEMNEKVELEKVTELENEIATLTATITNLMEQKDNSLPSVSALRIEIDRLMTEFDEVSQSALSIRVTKPRCIPDSVSTLTDLKYYIKSLHDKKDGLGSQLESLYKQRKAFDEAIAAMKENGVDDINGLAEKTKLLNEEVEAIASSTSVYEDFKDIDPNLLMGRYQSVKGVMIDTLTSIPDNSDNRYNVENEAVAMRKADTFDAYIKSLEDRRVELQHTLRHFEQAYDVECPDCKHQFKPGMLGFDPNKARNEMEEIGLKITGYESKLKRCREYLEDHRAFVTAKNCLIKVMTDNKVLQPLWKLLYDDKLFEVAPLSHIALIQSFDSLLENCITIQSIKDQIKLNETVLATINTTASNDFVKVLDDQIAEIITIREACVGEIGVVTQFYTKINRKSGYIERAEAVKTKLGDRLSTMVLSLVNKDVSDNLGQEQVKLARASNALNHIQRHDAVVNEIKVEKDKATHNLKIMTTLMKAISPTEGLISKYIQNFLDVFLEDVNIVIADIWTTSLEVMACAVDSSEVNCKFPLSVNEGYCLCDDISEASAGQIDIIDFAFRQTIALYLGLQDFPLYLDELAPTLDEQHRINLIRYLNDLMESKQFEQMFMISHYASNHYAFCNSDITMLDGRNIVDKPEHYNKCIEIVYNDSIVPKQAA